MKHNFTQEKLEREMTLEEVKRILSKTIVYDDVSKVITFLAALLTYTSEDQVNVAFKAESSTGKSYVVQEVLKHFPEEDITYVAYSSPTAFYHDEGELCDKDGNKINLAQKPKRNAAAELKSAWEKRLRKSAMTIDWEQKIIVFLDQPHDDLLKRLRPLLSHDRKKLAYKVTDKTGQYGLKTKTTIVKGYPTVFFCSSKVNMEDQERTRLFLLSPESTPEKIESSLHLASKRLSNRDKFRKFLEEDRERQWLIQRVCLIKDKKIRNIIIPSPNRVCDKFLKEHKNLAPRTQRDFPRLLAIIKAHALLNCFTRKQGSNNIIIIANQTDIDAGFKWYTEIVQSNELGLSPETYDFFKRIFEGETDGLTNDGILRKYYETYHRTLDIWRLKRDILPALKGAGIISEQSDPFDRRFRKYIPLKGGVVFSTKIDVYEDVSAGSLPEESDDDNSSANIDDYAD